MRCSGSVLVVVSALLSSCGQTGNNSAATNDASSRPGTVAPANSVISTSATTPSARPVRFGVDGEHGMDACHTSGRIIGNGNLAVRNAPNGSALEVAQLAPGQDVVQCELASGWVGIVWAEAGRGDQDCGVGQNLPGPRNYDGPCRSGWVPENRIEITAG